MSEFCGYTIWHHVPHSIHTDVDWSQDLMTTTYKFLCSVCGDSVDQPWYGNALALPEHAGKGWIEASPGIWICPQHKVVITVDGEEFKP